MTDLYEIVEKLVNEKLNDNMIERIIEERVMDQFRYDMDKAIENEAHRIVHELGAKYIEEQIDQVIARGVRVDNGWGKPDTYESFDSFVRSEIERELKNTWQLERRVKETCEKVIKEVCKRYAEARMEPTINDVIDALAGGDGGSNSDG